MIRFFALVAIFAITAPDARAQTVTSPVRLVDSSPKTPGLIVNKAVTTPRAAKGTVLFDCGSAAPPFVYGVGAAAACAPALGTQKEAVAAPIVTTATEAGSALKYAARWTDLHQLRAQDAFVIGKSDPTGRPLVQDVVIDLARYGVTMRQRDGSYATASVLMVRRVAITASEAPIYIRGGSSNIVIEDARLTCTGTSSGIPAGIKIGAANSPSNYDITIRRASITGCISKDRKGYTQGDGIATERPDHDITIVDTTSTDHGDGCLDLKSSATRLDNVTVARCNYGARLWAQGAAGTLTIGDVRKAAIQIKPSTRWTIDRLVLTGDRPAEADIVTDGAGGVLTVAQCSRPVTTRLAKGTTVILGSGCVR